MDEILNDLKRSPIFAAVDSADLSELARAARAKRYKSGELIFRESDPAEGFFVVTQGNVRVFKMSPDGRERTLHIIRPPQSFAEAALFGSSGGYPAFAEAISDTSVILVPRRPFMQMLQDRPQTTIQVFESLSQWVHRLLDELENESFLNARAKLASYILREFRRRPPESGPTVIRLNQPKKKIASQLGMAPETFSRAQSDLENNRLIVVSGRSIELPDPAALEAFLLGEME